MNRHFPLLMFVFGCIVTFGLMRWLDGGPSPEWKWKNDQRIDSLQRGWDSVRVELESQRDSTDAIRKERDSIEASRVPDTVYVREVWRRVKLMDINAKMDSLKSL